MKEFDFHKDKVWLPNMQDHQYEFLHEQMKPLYERLRIDLGAILRFTEMPNSKIQERKKEYSELMEEIQRHLRKCEEMTVMFY